MASTPMAIDSPKAPGRQNGLSSSTAKLADVISTYRPTKLFRRDPPSHGKGQGSHATVMSLDFDDEGGLLVTTESDSSLQIYNVKEGKKENSCLSQKYGAMHAKFTHTNTCIIHSSTKQNNTIRYLSTHDNSYIRYFEGHTDAVTCLSMHPGTDNFLSCSLDNTLRVWNANSKNGSGKLLLNGAYLSAWDPSGNVFAVASPPAQSILLYDFRNYDRAPFATFDVLQHCHDLAPNPVGKGWTKLEFSNDGKSLLLGTTGPGHLLLDAFDGHLKGQLRRSAGDQEGARRLAVGESNPEHVDASSSEYLYPTTGDACFTPDGRYVLNGSKGHNVLVWDTLATALEKRVLPLHELEYKGDTAVLAFNPRYNFFAGADKEVVFWVPDPNY